jgi:hypothetical protein
MKAHRYAMTGLFAASLLIAVPTETRAQARPYQYQTVDQRAFDNGYREGLAQGERDAMDGRLFSFVRAEGYRLGDDGYRREDGPLGDYRRMFRQGFEAGYRDGYERDAPTTGPRARTNELSAAVEIGFRDGYDEGLKDLHDHQSYDPVRSDKYRSGDHHYDRRYGTRDEFKREYRLGFEQGYERAYRAR